MVNKELQFNKDARTSMLKGMKLLADAVGSTLGPKGKCVVIDEAIDGRPLITKDGVTVAKSIQLKDKFQNLGAQLLKEASITSGNLAGDGTTTTVVMAYAMITQAQKLIEQDYDPIQIKNGIKEAANSVLVSLKESAIPVTDDDLSKIATISANNDPEIGKLIANTFKEIGRDGVVTVEESPSIKTYTEIINGMQFERGYESPHFATDPIKGTCTLENCYVLLTDHKIQLMRDIVPILEIAAKTSNPILLIAQDYDDEVIQNLKLNKLRNILQVCAVKSPSYGDYRKEILEDLAILTGATVISYESGIELHKVTEEMLGRCKKVTVTKETTTIIEGAGSQDLINKRVEQIKNQLDTISGELDRDFLKEFYAQRIAKLVGGIARIYVGGTTELEMRERKDRIDDAVCATKSAIEEGYVPGGGISFINASHCCDNLNSQFNSIILIGLYSVLNQILNSCGLDNLSEAVVSGKGFDANKEEWVDMIEAGIINPVKSDRLAFENALSVLNLYLSTSTLIVNEDIQY